ncbi:hypothetical protein GWK47_044595 [Chionoecetes opilio]|uniref:Uncharacterized protein n=1 Tax=Chionoecetes opilio TaxID=41210 RepID=A0A8J4YJ28_CHIOP|nr:hypothetical protein GWK47_044595 [Chionoecetes opilio]
MALMLGKGSFCHCRRRPRCQPWILLAKSDTSREDAKNVSIQGASQALGLHPLLGHLVEDQNFLVSASSGHMGASGGQCPRRLRGVQMLQRPASIWEVVTNFLIGLGKFYLVFGVTQGKRAKLPGALVGPPPSFVHPFPLFSLGYSLILLSRDLPIPHHSHRGFQLPHDVGNNTPFLIVK